MSVAKRKPAPTSEQDLELLRLIDEQYTRRPFYGSRKMVAYLREQGHRVNRKRVLCPVAVNQPSYPADAQILLPELAWSTNILVRNHSLPLAKCHVGIQFPPLRRSL